MFYFFDTVTNGFKLNILNILILLAIYCGILVITTKNPIVSVLFLIILFFNVACYLIMLGLNFIGLSYLLIYVGAISILFLFILMLINIRISELLSQTRNSIPLVVIVTCLIYFIVGGTLPNKNNDFNTLLLDKNLNSSDNINNISSKTIDNINFTSSFNWDGNLLEYNTMSSMGNIMFTSYPIWLIITSLILLLGMAGIIVITLGTSSNNSPQPHSFKALPRESGWSFTNLVASIFLLSKSKTAFISLMTFVRVVFTICNNGDMEFLGFGEDFLESFLKENNSGQSIDNINNIIHKATGNDNTGSANTNTGSSSRNVQNDNGYDLHDCGTAWERIKEDIRRKALSYRNIREIASSFNEDKHLRHIDSHRIDDVERHIDPVDHTTGLLVNTTGIKIAEYNARVNELMSKIDNGTVTDLDKVNYLRIQKNFSRALVTFTNHTPIIRNTY